jgi:D-alanyl-D-alanine carboxypeptidase (penicillin-binding protein 5/6)
MPRFKRVLAALASFFVFFAMLTQAAPVLAQQVQPPEVAARAYLVLDITANQILAAKDIDSPIEPASLTKLMTAYLVFDALRAKKIDLKQTLGVSERAWKMPGSRMFIDPKMKVPVEDLIKGMIVQSGNDATVALAEGVGGTVERFVQMMNERAKILGMKSTSFTNPEGLTEPGHSTSARDLSLLATRLLQDLLLFRDPSVDGLKTGHTAAAGFCMIATAKRDVPGLGVQGAQGNRRLMAIVLGAASENARATEAQKLLNWGYTAFEVVKLFDAAQPVVSPPVWKGKSNVVNLGRPEAIVVAVPAGSGAKLKTQVVRPNPLVAPFRRGQAIGTLRVTAANDVVVAEVPLLALDAVDEAGVLGRAWDSIRLWIK